MEYLVSLVGKTLKSHSILQNKRPIVAKDPHFPMLSVRLQFSPKPYVKSVHPFWHSQLRSALSNAYVDNSFAISDAYMENIFRPYVQQSWDWVQ